jgi:hypothetical protein
MSKNDKNRAARANYGIQANQVSAEVLAVGENARASKTSLGPVQQQEFHAAVLELQAALNSLNLQPQAKAAIDKDVEVLRAETNTGDVNVERAGNTMQNLSGKLKTMGVVLSEVVGLAEPLQKLAAILHIPLHFLGV